MIMKLSDYVIEFFAQRGVKVFFGYQGGSVTHLIDSVAQNDNVLYVQNYHEQGAAFAADAYARCSEEKVGVVIASNGPGATNLITGIANAYCDSIPLICITGQVHTFSMKKQSGVRQESFQEIDIISMVKPITKYCVTVMDSEDIRLELEKAYYYALEGRKGPVLIDLPVDIQGMSIMPNTLKAFKKDRKDLCNKLPLEKFEIIYNHILNAKRPVIIAGGGINMAGAKEEFELFIHNFGIPVVCSLQGIDAISHNNEYFCGFIGSYGNRNANIAVQNADIIIVLGSRLDSRQTGKNKENFAPEAFVIHVDIDKNELNHNVHEELSIHMDLKVFIQELNRFSHIKGRFDDWTAMIKSWEKLFEDEVEQNKELKYIGKLLGDNVAICSDVGQNQMWMAQSLRVYGDNFRIINSGGLGAMGYSLPAAIGLYYTNKFNQVLAVMGDGGFQMNLQELCLIGSMRLPIIIVLLNNHSLGLIRDIHEKYYESRCVGSIDGFFQPDIHLLAESYSINYIKIKSEDELKNKIKNLLIDKPLIIDIDINHKTIIKPELIGGDKLDRQTPYISDAIFRTIKKDCASL